MSAAVRPVALVGLPGVGKTTVARLLAEQLGWEYADTDAEVAALTGRSPAAILQNDGEESFRRVELDALKQVLVRTSRVVIACGGGLPLQNAARALLGARTSVVWLDAPDPVLLQRVGDALDRPLLAPDPAVSLPALRRARDPVYASAQLHVRSDAQARIVAERISEALDASLLVETPSRAYHVTVRSGALDDVTLYVPGMSTRVAIVADLAVRGLAKRVAGQLKDEGRSVTIIGVRGGERIKTWASAGRLVARLGAAGVRRNDCVIALGGGSVGDLAGFAAATHLRGVAWVNVPTTLLAMVDSAIGGKTGVNLPRGKNLAGAVWQPCGVVCDPASLAGLPERQYRGALAEVVKYSMVFGDGLTEVLDRDLDALLRREESKVVDVIRRSVEAKARAVAADERETGPRAVLNYGHTVGHALETATNYASSLNHGEAVAAGMRVAGALSVAVLDCPRSDVEWQDSLLRRCGLGDAPRVPLRRVMTAMSRDKKGTGVGVGWVLLEARGRARYGQLVPEHLVEEQLGRVLPT
jgi:shikimate kinase/3-dehydroquinate synthase